MAKVSLITLYDKGCLGVRYLSSCLKQNGHTTSIIYLESHKGKIRSKQDRFTSDDNLWISVNEWGRDIIRSYSEPISENDAEILLGLLDRLKPDLIGFSLRSMFLDAGIELSRRIPQVSKAPIVFGGIAATCQPEKCIQYADTVCIGEGEQSIIDLARRLDRGTSFSDVKNLWLRHNSQICKNGLYSIEQDLDRIPFPDYEPENKFWIYNSRLIEHDRSIGNMSAYTYEIITSRGCPFSCSYCCNDLLKRVYPGQQYLRRRSVSNVITELKEAKQKYNIKSVLFKDEIFTFDHNWINEFAESYKREVALPFWCYTHPLFADEGILRELKDCGLYSVTMGIQSGSTNILYNVYNRRTPIEKIIAAAAVLERLNLPIRPRYDIITNNPFEKDQDCRQTLELLMSLSKPVNFGLTKLSLVPGSRIAGMPQPQALDAKSHRFWNNLYLLNQFCLFPNSLIRALSRSNFMRRHPEFLQPLLIIKLLQNKGHDLGRLIKRLLPKGVILWFKQIRYNLKGY